MAIFYLGMKTFSRGRGSRGSRSTSAAAYRAGERIRDEGTGHVYDHRRRTDVMHKEIILPSRLAAQHASLEWARDRGRLWNAAEHAEPRRNARVAREFIVALPHELSAPARTQLARQFAQDIADRYRSAVDLAIHAPRGDARNFHAHLLSTTREVAPDGLGPKTTLELSGTRRRELGLPRWREEIASLREHWATLANRTLEREHIAARVSHLGRAETVAAAAARPPRVPIAAYYMERRGERSLIAERIRERHRAMLGRALDEGAREAPERIGPDHGPSLSRQRTLLARGYTAMRRFGTSVAAAWRTAKERLAEHPTLGEPRGLERSVRVRETAAQAGAGVAGQSRAAREGRPREPSVESLRQALDWGEGTSHLREHRVESASEPHVGRRYRHGLRMRLEYPQEHDQGREHEYGHERARWEEPEHAHEASRHLGEDSGFSL